RRLVRCNLGRPRSTAAVVVGCAGYCWVGVDELALVDPLGEDVDGLGETIHPGGVGLAAAIAAQRGYPDFVVEMAVHAVDVAAERAVEDFLQLLGVLGLLREQLLARR
ncbi:unnamed protein product, partial [Linum tenue]